MCDALVTRLLQTIDQHIPVRKAGTQNRHPWTYQDIRDYMHKRDKWYRRWNRSGKPNGQKKFLDLKHLVLRLVERSYPKYLGDILGLNADTNDLDNSAPPKVKHKKFYSLLKHSEQDSSGVAPLKEGRTFSVETDKANSL